MGNLHISRILHLLRCRKESVFLPQIKAVSNHHLHHQQKANKSHKMNPKPFAAKTICLSEQSDRKNQMARMYVKPIYAFSSYRQKRKNEEKGSRDREGERERGGRKESRRRDSILSQEMNHFLPPVFLLSLRSLHYQVLPSPCNKKMGK